MTMLVASWQNLPHPRVLLIGDLMLDRYTQGQATRVSPEAPVLILNSAEPDDLRPGGAGNVALNLHTLEAEVVLVGVVGADGDGRVLQHLLQESGIKTTGIIADADRITTSKHRLIGQTGRREPQHLLRLDREWSQPLSTFIEAQLKHRIAAELSSCDAVLISDYAKGVCTPSLVRFVIEAAWRAEVPVLVDPSRNADYAKYTGATLIAPNRSAAELVAGRTLRTSAQALLAAEEFRRRLQVAAVVITLDREGLVYVTADERGHLPARSGQVQDVTGAGDMVLSVLGLCQATRWSLVESLQVANTAAGLEVQQCGVVPLSRAEIATALTGETPASGEVATEQLTHWVRRQRQAGRKIVFTNGCFDLLHVGHVQLLQAAARLGDRLIVAINSDASVRRLKGPERPIIGEQDRARMLAALECVDQVVIFDEDTPHRLLEQIRPDLLVKGGTTGDIIGREVVEAYGGQVHRLSTIPQHSTSRLVQQIRQTQSAGHPEVLTCG